MEINSEPTGLAKEIYEKINEVRTTPSKLANKITLMLSYINKRDNILREPNKPIVKLVEGMKAYEEAISYLKSFEPVEALNWEDSISKIAQDHASDIGHKGASSNDSTDPKIKFKDRFQKFGTYSDIQECLFFNETDAVKIVMNLIVCDGDSKRINRGLILSSNLRQIGIGHDKHIKQTNVVVIDMARNWKLRTKGPTSVISDNKTEISNSKYSKVNDYQIDLTGIKQNSSTILVDKEELIQKYEKELEDDIWFDDIQSKKEEKQIIEEGEKIKIIKKVTFTFNDGSIRKIILSKTFLVK
jgi:hypothetical protein